MKAKSIQVAPDILKDRFEAKGCSINGIATHICERYKYERKEIDSDGFVLFHFFEPFGYLHRNFRGRHRYICHPLKRNDLETQERRN